MLNILFPFLPASSLKMILNGHEKSIILDPLFFTLQKLGIIQPALPCHLTVQILEIKEGFLKDTIPVLIHQMIVNTVCATAPVNFGQIRLHQKPILHQKIQVNKIRISRKS